MILRSLICQEVANYLESDDWLKLMDIVKTGSARHLHIYSDSILHPQSLIKLLEAYLPSQGWPLRRKMYVLNVLRMPNLTNIYSIFPREDMGHLEWMLKYSEDVVLSPMTNNPFADATLQFWDDAYMEKYYSQFGFRAELSNQDEKDLLNYFSSPEWQQQCDFVLGGPSRHVHSVVRTSIHPEVIKEVGRKAIEAKGWKVTQANSVTFGLKGIEWDKITYILAQPEIILELEVHFDPEVSIKPAEITMNGQTSYEDVINAMRGKVYIELDELAVQSIIKSLKPKAKIAK